MNIEMLTALLRWESVFVITSRYGAKTDLTTSGVVFRSFAICGIEGMKVPDTNTSRFRQYICHTSQSYSQAINAVNAVMPTKSRFAAGENRS